MTKTYADTCLERASKATEGPWVWATLRQSGQWTYCPALITAADPIRDVIEADSYTLSLLVTDAEFIAHSRTDVPELARRLNRACETLRAMHFKNLSPNSRFDVLADELEAPLEEK